MEGEVVTIGTVAARNLARALQLPDSAVPEIELAIADEIQALSSHFALTLADVRTQYDTELAKLSHDRGS